MKRITERQPRSTAYHEAGHAVAAVVHGIRFGYVTIKPGDGTLGHLLLAKFSNNFHPDITVTPRDVMLIHNHAIISFAGAAAAGLLVGKDFAWTGAGKDREDAINLVSFLECEPDALGAYLRMLMLQARNLVRFRRDKIEAVANALLQQERLDHVDVRAIVSALPEGRRSWASKIPPLPNHSKPTTDPPPSSDRI